MRFFLIFILSVIICACEPITWHDKHTGEDKKTILNKIDSLIKVSDLYFASANFNDSLFDKHLLEAFTYTYDFDLHEKQIDIYRKVGKRYRNISDFGVALFFYQKSLEIANQFENERLKAYIKSDMAVVFRRIDDNAKALNLHFKALEWAESAKDTFMILSSYNGIGNVYISYKNMPKAIEYFHRSLTLLNNGFANKLSEAINTNNIGEAWLAIGNSDSALYYVQKSYDINRELGSKLGQAICESGIGDIYMHLNNYNQAILHYKESLKLNREVGNLIYIAGTLQNLGKAYLMLENYNLSEQHLLNALQISKEIGSKSNIVETLSNLSELHRRCGKKDMALNYLDEAMVYKDTITDEVSRLNSEGMNALYKTEKQEREILILKQRDELSQLALKRQRWFFISTIIIISGGLVFSIFAIYQRRAILRYTRQIQNQNTNIRNSIRYA